MLVKRCPECREDYMPHVERCADCGAVLVARDDEAPLDGEAEAESPLPPGEYRVLLAADRAAELDPLVARLARAGVPAKVTVSRRGTGFELRVRDEERPRAVELLHDVVGAAAAAEAALERHFDAERGGYAHCPACESSLPAGATECAECGLLLGGEAPTCEGCGVEIDPTAARCGSCGHTVPQE
jgi:predicted amidophosphoribosyltransferase